jgi:hypothetical protein
VNAKPIMQNTDGVLTVRCPYCHKDGKYVMVTMTREPGDTSWPPEHPSDGTCQRCAKDFRLGAVRPITSREGGAPS